MKFIENQIIKISVIDERIKKIASYKGKSSMMHFKKLVNQVSKEFVEHGMSKEMLWRNIENQMYKIYKTCRNAL